MRMIEPVRITGKDILSKKFQKLLKAVGPDEAEPILLEGAKIMANAIRDRAPRGPTGNLKRSIIYKTLRRKGDSPAPAIAAVDYKIGPHAHFVEYGTSQAPPHPFFRPAVDSKQAEVGAYMTKALRSRIEKAANK